MLLLAAGIAMLVFFFFYTQYTPTGFVKAPAFTVPVTENGLLKPRGIRNGFAYLVFEQGNLTLMAPNGFRRDSLSRNKGRKVVLDEGHGQIYVVNKNDTPLSFGWAINNNIDFEGPYTFVLTADGLLEAVNPRQVRRTMTYKPVSEMALRQMTVDTQFEEDNAPLVDEEQEDRKQLIQFAGAF